MVQPAHRSRGVRHRGWLVLLAVAALVAAGCSSGSQSAGSGGELRIGTDEGVDSLNPFVGLAQDAYNTWEQIYPQLVQYDTRTLQFVPDFATRWTVSKNYLTWTFTTRANAHWSDGAPLTAADAAWTYNTVIKFQNNYAGADSSFVQYMTSASAPSSTTLVLRYSRPVPNVLANMQNASILPEHVWKKYAAGNGAGLKQFPNTPTPGHPVVSGGPFMCVKYVQGEIALFQRNPYFYGPKPLISGFGLQVFTNDDAMVEALKDNGIDAIENVPVTDVATVRAAGFHVYVGPSLTWRDLIINTNPHKIGHRELLNPLVREALEYATNRQQIIQTAWLGYGEPGTTMVPPATGKWHDPYIKPLPFDLAKANALLNQAGYRMGPNGVRIADGHPMSYVVDFSSDQNGPGDRAFQILQADYAKIGVQITQRTVDPTTEFSLITNPNNKYLTYDMAMWWWVPIIDPGFILGVTTCAQYGAWSDSGYCNPGYDRLYGQLATMDPAKRLRVAYELQRWIYNARPYIVLNYNDTINAWSTRWTGFVESPQGFFTQLSKQSLEQLHQAA